MSIIVTYKITPAMESDKQYKISDVLKVFTRDVSWGTFREKLEAVDITLNNVKNYKKIEPKILNKEKARDEDGLEVYTVRIKFSNSQFDFENEGINHFIGTIAGDVIKSSKIKKIEILEFSLPRELYDWFPGPNLNVNQLKSTFFNETLKTKRPLLAFSVKPRVGLNVAEYKKILRKASETNLDIIEDDERLVSPNDCSFDERINVLKSLIDEGKTKCKFSINLTGNPHTIKERFINAYNAGIRIFKLDVMVTGFDTLLYLRRLLDNPEYAPCIITVFPDVYGANYRSLSRKFILKLCRLCGANIIYAGSPFPSRMGEIRENYSEEWLEDIQEWMDDCNIYHNILLDAIDGAQNINSCLPTITHDVDPVLMEILIYSLKNLKNDHMDYAFFVGGGISGFPCKLDLKKSIELWIKVIEFASANDECLNIDIDDIFSIKGFDFRKYEDCMNEAGLNTSRFK